jgi:histidinol-phosphate aminotransferase
LPLLFPDISYSFYPVYCGLYRIAFETVPLMSISRSARRTTPGPTAASSSPTRTRRPAACCPGRDGADPQGQPGFGGGGRRSLRRLRRRNRDPLVAKYPNLLVVQTLSKSRSLAGLRVGLAVGHPDLIEALERVKNSFNSYPLDRLAIVGAAAAFDGPRVLREDLPVGDRQPQQGGRAIGRQGL